MNSTALEVTRKDAALCIVPILQKTAKRFIAEHHRHNLPSIGAVFSIGVKQDGVLVGVAMVGLPKARHLMDGFTLEVTRVCGLELHKNVNSALYSACARAAAALGYARLVTYTLPSESGASLRGAGWRRDEELRPWTDWERVDRPARTTLDLFGNERIPTGPKIRWWKDLK